MIKMPEAWEIVLKQVGPVDYLAKWIKTMLYDPFTPTDYLFLYGPQAGGKTMFQNAVSLLTMDAVRVDNFFDRGFNAPLATAILCNVEGTNVNENPERINAWVNARFLEIYRARLDPERVRNKTHWIQASNNIKECPIFGKALFMDTLAKPIHGAVLLSALKCGARQFKECLNDY